MFHMTECNVHNLTLDQPFCAGVVLVRNNTLTVTLNTDHIPHTNAPVYRIGAIGGGQEPSETVHACALREAQEETGCSFILQDAEQTYLHDLDHNVSKKIHCTDAISPYLIQFKRNPPPYTPYKLGLPVGPYTFYVMFKATTSAPRLSPNDDVHALLECPLQKWPYLEQGITIAHALNHGCTLIEKKQSPVDRTSSLWVPQDESMRMVHTLLLQKSRKKKTSLSSIN
ncbi:hypothetical protein A374_04029 [Fictibacillus macauensis ZFHKF-1]|uniref:Nudix hydrolase domain-containing protein n=1 Tax=Fictibacillus macauensis ZFHKF-1 TaxID=1196324 RepID=I8UIJ0_9BACL|nr:NUDIX domain-containing protein [Fictibacillus macauensis]EIT86710.1 hypothetical protein A374_04029 [Fictibacillus macauensis ZFHKF-1]